MKNRQILKVFLSSLFVLALAACGGNDTSSKQVSNSSQVPSTPSISSPAPVEKIDYVANTKKF